MSVRYSIRLEMICIDFPDPKDYPDLYLGYFEGKVFQQESTLDEAFRAGELGLWCNLEVKLDEENQKAIFYGPAAQGGPADRFIYLGWLFKKGNAWETFQRIKLPLSIFPYNMVVQAVQTQRDLRVRISVKDRRDRPAAASLKPEQLQVML